MSQTKGWIKLERHLSNKTFSKNTQLNTECYVIYGYLVEKAAWGDHDGLHRGQLRFKAKDAQIDVFPELSIDRIKKIVRTLAEVNYVKSTFLSSYKNDGMLIEICHYDDFGGEICQKGVYLNCTSTVPQVNLANFDKAPESLDNNHVTTTECTSTVPQLYLNCTITDCSSIIEERKKEREERKVELNTLQNFSDEKCLPPDIILNDPSFKAKKARKITPKKEINHQEALDTFYSCYQEKYGVKPLINAKVIKHLKDLVNRCGKEASKLIAFYLSHNNSFYLSKAHSIEYALKDCEKLHTEMNKNNYIFQRDANRVEDVTANNILKESILKRIRNGEL